MMTTRSMEDLAAHDVRIQCHLRSSILSVHIIRHGIFESLPGESVCLWLSALHSLHDHQYDMRYATNVARLTHLLLRDIRSRFLGILPCFFFTHILPLLLLFQCPLQPILIQLDLIPVLMFSVTHSFPHLRFSPGRTVLLALSRCICIGCFFELFSGESLCFGLSLYTLMFGRG